MKLSDWSPELLSARVAYSGAKWAYTHDGGSFRQVTLTAEALMAAWHEAKIVGTYCTSEREVEEAYFCCKAEDDQRLHAAAQARIAFDKEYRDAAAAQSAARWAKADEEYRALKIAKYGHE